MYLLYSILKGIQLYLKISLICELEKYLGFTVKICYLTNNPHPVFAYSITAAQNSIFIELQPCFSILFLQIVKIPLISNPVLPLPFSEVLCHFQICQHILFHPSYLSKIPDNFYPLRNPAPIFFFPFQGTTDMTVLWEWFSSQIFLAIGAAAWHVSLAFL